MNLIRVKKEASIGVILYNISVERLILIHVNSFLLKLSC